MEQITVDRTLITSVSKHQASGLREIDRDQFASIMAGASKYTYKNVGDGQLVGQPVQQQLIRRSLPKS